MSIELDKALGVWYVDLEGGNWLCTLIEEPEKPGHFEIVFRTRWYEDDRTDEFSEDSKTWYKGTMNDPPNLLSEALEAPRKMAKKLALLTDTGVYELLRGDMTVEEFVEEFSKAPFAHVQKLDKAEAH